MGIIEEFKKIIEEIAVVESRLLTARRELDRKANAYRPAGMRGIDYTRERVSNSLFQQDIFSLSQEIEILKDEIKRLKRELKEMHEQKRKLEKIINDYGDVKKQIFMMKLKKVPIDQIARKLFISRSTVYRNIADMMKPNDKNTLVK